MLKIPIRRLSIEKTNKLRHGTLFPNIIRGPTNCGKTNLVFTFLMHDNSITFENIHIYSKTLDQVKYVMLEKTLSQVQGVNLFKFNDNKTVITPEKALPNSVFIFNDVKIKALFVHIFHVVGTIRLTCVI